MWLLLASSCSATRFFPVVVPGRFSRFFSGSEFAAFSCGPAGFVDLADARDSQAMRRNVFRDRRTSGHVRVIADAYRSDENGIAADENAFANMGGVLLEAVVVAGDRAGSDVGFWADLGIAKIGQMRHFCAFADSGLFCLHKVADARAGLQM